MLFVMKPYVTYSHLHGLSVQCMCGFFPLPIRDKFTNGVCLGDWIHAEKAPPKTYSMHDADSRE